MSLTDLNTIRALAVALIPLRSRTYRFALRLGFVS
jgi:hypothetical protein